MNPDAVVFITAGVVLVCFYLSVHGPAIAKYLRNSQILGGKMHIHKFKIKGVSCGPTASDGTYILKQCVKPDCDAVKTRWITGSWSRDQILGAEEKK